MRSLVVVVLLATAAGAADPPVAPVAAKLGSLDRKLTDHPMLVRVLADGSTTAVVTFSGELTTWDPKTGRRLSEDRFTASSRDYVSTGAISPDGHDLYVWLNERGLVRYDARAKKTTPLSVVAPDGKWSWADLAVSADGRTLAAKLTDKPRDQHRSKLVIWDRTNGGLKKRRTVACEYGQTLAVSPDGKWVAHVVYARKSDDAPANSTIHLMDTTTGEPVREFGKLPGTYTVAGFSPDGNRLLTHGLTVGTAVWDTATGGLVREWKPPVGGGESLFTAAATGVFVGSGKLNDATYRRFDLATGAAGGEFPTRTEWVGGAGVTADGRTLVTTAGDWVVRFWDVGAVRERFPVTGHAGNVSAVAWLPDGSAVVSGGNDSTVRVWDAATGVEKESLPPVAPTLGRRAHVSALAVARSGQRIAAGQYEYGVRIWDRGSGRVFASAASDFFPAKHDGTRTFPPPVRAVAFANDESKVRVLVEANGELLLETFTADAQRVGPDSRMPREFGKGEKALIRDEPLVSLEAGLGAAYYEGDETDEFRVWNFATNEVLSSLKLAEGARPRPLAIAPTGRVVVTNDYFATDVRQLRVSDPKTLAEIGQMLTPKPLPLNARCQFSADGRLFAVEIGRTPTQFLVFDVARLTAVATVANQYRISRLAFAPDGRRVATGGMDSRIFIHDLRAAIDPNPPAALDAAACWTDLVSPDGTTALRAAYRLADHPAAAVKLVRERLKPVPPPAAADVTAWVKTLSAPAFAERQTAAKKLTAIADAVEPELRRAAAKDASPEAAEAIATLLESTARARRKLEGDYLRAYRAVQVLEMIGPPAAEALKEYAAGAKGAFLTHEAEAARGRMK